jgi:hypothetical protein
VDIVVFGKQRILVCAQVVHKDVLAMKFSRDVLKMALTRPEACAKATTKTASRAARLIMRGFPE